jgi:hypothetical protein
LGAELPGRFQVSLPRAVTLDINREKIPRIRQEATAARNQVKAGDQFDEAAFEASSSTLCANTAHICCVDHSHRFGELSVRLSAVYHEFSNLVAMVDDRRLPSETRAYFGGFSVLIPLIAGEQLKLCRPTGGNSSNWWLRSQGRHCDGNATAPPGPAAVPVVFRDRHVLPTRVRLCGCAGRPYLSQSTSQLHEIMGAKRTKRTRRVHPASSWHHSRTGMSLPCAQKMSSRTCAFGR